MFCLQVVPHGFVGVSNLQQAIGFRAVIAGHKLIRILLLIEILNRYVVLLSLRHDSNK